jgi:serine/alanine adding enzyme
MAQLYQNYKIVDYNQLSPGQWRSFIMQHSGSSVFHSDFMFKVYGRTPFHFPFALFALDNQGTIQAMLSGHVQTVMSGILKGLSSRAVMMQSPIYVEKSALDALLSHYSHVHGYKTVYSEIRNHIDSTDSKSIYFKHGYTFEDHLDILINLNQSPDLIFQNFEATRRKQINRGYKRGAYAVVIPNSDIEGIMQCLKIIQEVYLRIHLPVPVPEMIQAAALESGDDGKLVCFALKSNGEIIGTRMVLCYKDKIFDWYAGSKVEHYDKYPNDILPWEVFKWGHENGYKEFDFGGAGKPNIPYGVRDYKLKFGGELVNFGRFHKVHSKIKYFIASHGFKAIKQIKSLSSKVKGINQ